MKAEINQNGRTKFNISKRAGLNIVLIIIIVIVSGLVIFSITGSILKTAPQGLQSEICRANIIGANAVLKDDDSENNLLEKLTWEVVKDQAAIGSVQNPLCLTHVETFDLRKTPADQLNYEVGIKMGEMIENCWRTFGEGKINQTFGQHFKFLSDDVNNYYFSCYKIKFVMPKTDDKVFVKDLMQADSGMLWTYNVKGRQIEKARDGKYSTQEDFIQNQKEYFTTGDKANLPYAGYVFWEGKGYIEFAKEVNPKANSEGIKQILAGDDKLGYMASGAIVLVAALNFWNPGGWVLLAGVVAGGVAGGLTADYFIGDGDAKSIFPSENLLSSIDSDQYYEVRYYSPYFSSDEEAFAINSIKIVPIGEGYRYDAQEIEPIK